MNLHALQHLAKAAQALADDCQIVVLGSASLLASFPDLGHSSGPLASTFDADLCPQPFDENTGKMLEEALGESRAFHSRHGYHADILRDSILETLPVGWRERLVPVPDCASVLALEPHDLAAVKLLVGRPKDLALVRILHEYRLIQADTVRERLHLLNLPVASQPRPLASFNAVFVPQPLPPHPGLTPRLMHIP
ncbi:MAG: hypothetical protein NTW21_33050 [Verrucomicrobia bacterium]|nr:hypothetical protein [Verrucomicrobiota bacterium]